MSEVINQIIDVNINIYKRRRCNFGGDNDYHNHNCTQKSDEGAEDVATESEKKDAVPDPIRLEDEIDLTKTG